MGLVNEATGYQKVRHDRALAKFLAEFISAELQKWTKTFPDEFYREIYRLHGWEYTPQGGKFSQVLGHYTDDIVYRRLAPGVFDELKQMNPILPAGYRAHKHHSFLHSISVTRS